jgi:hypothetical protein
MSTMGAKVQWMPTARAPLDGRWVPRGGERDRDRQDRPQPVDDVEAEEQRDAVPAALQREALQPVGLGRVRDEQQRAGATAPQRALDLARLVVTDPDAGTDLGVRQRTEVEQLGQLPGLLLDGELREQLLDAGVDRPGIADSRARLLHRASPSSPAAARAPIVASQGEAIGGGQEVRSLPARRS